MLMFSPAICFMVGSSNCGLQVVSWNGDKRWAEDSHPSLEAPLFQTGKGKAVSQLTACTISVCVFPQEKVVGCYLKSLKIMPMVQSSCTYRTVAVSHQDICLMLPFFNRDYSHGNKNNF